MVKTFCPQDFDFPQHSGVGFLMKARESHSPSSPGANQERFVMSNALSSSGTCGGGGAGNSPLLIIPPPAIAGRITAVVPVFKNLVVNCPNGGSTDIELDMGEVEGWGPFLDSIHRPDPDPDPESHLRPDLEHPGAVEPGRKELEPHHSHRPLHRHFCQFLHRSPHRPPPRRPHRLGPHASCGRPQR